jgi:hypothetical protein
MREHACDIDTNIHEVGTSRAQTPSQHSSIRSFFKVPNRRVRGFLGREDVLARIADAFSPITGAPRIVVVRGLGGEGKTQVALEYCRRTKDRGVRAIFWVDATSESTVKKSFETMLESIDPGQAVRDDAIVGRLLEKLAGWPETRIMVFDNHDDPSAFNLQDFMPEGGNGCLLVTSRHADTENLTDPENAIELQGLAKKDGLDLLFKQSRAEETESSRQDGKAIIERLSHHALAITQAGSYFRLWKIRVHQFLDHYNRQRKEILQQTPHMSQYRRSLSDSAKETSLNVFTTWELSFQQLQANDGESQDKEDLMIIFAFFDCKDISEKLFETHCHNPDNDLHLTGAGRGLGFCLNAQRRWSQDKFVEILNELTRISLVQTWYRDVENVCHLSLHPLVTDLVRLRMGVTDFQKYVTVASKILGDLLRSYAQQNKRYLSPLIKGAIYNHINAYKENVELLKMLLKAEEFRPVYDELWHHETWLLDFLAYNDQYKEAEGMLRRIIVRTIFPSNVSVLLFSNLLFPNV